MDEMMNTVKIYCTQYGERKEPYVISEAHPGGSERGA